MGRRWVSWIGAVLLVGVIAGCPSSNESRPPAESSAGEAAATALEAPTEPMLARIGDRALGDSDLSPEAHRKLTELALEAYAVRHSELTEELDRRVLKLAARDAGVTPTVFLDRETKARAGEPTVAEIEAALEDGRLQRELDRQLATIRDPERDLPEGVPVPPGEVARIKEVRESIRRRAKASLERERQAEAREALAQEWREKYGAELLLPLPEVPRVSVPARDFFEVQGPAAPGAAEHTVHLYIDAITPASRRALEAVMAATQGKESVRVMVSHLPQGSRPHSMKLAEAVRCAEKQGRAADFHAALVQGASPPATGELVQIATKVALNVGAFQLCLTGEEVGAEILAARNRARAVGEAQAPVVFVDGIRLGHQQTRLVAALLDAPMDDGGEGT